MNVKRKWKIIFSMILIKLLYLIFSNKYNFQIEFLKIIFGNFIVQKENKEIEKEKTNKITFYNIILEL